MYTSYSSLKCQFQEKKDTWEHVLLSETLHVKIKKHIVTLVVSAFYRIPVLTLKLLDIGLPVTQEQKRKPSGGTKF